MGEPYVEDPLTFKTCIAEFPERFLTIDPLDKFMTADSCSNEEFRAIYDYLEYDEKLPYKKSKPINTKTKEMSCRFRLKGNEEFKRNLTVALIYYSKSIAAAPYPGSDADVSTELALGFANRSAVYAKMKKYEAALKDIEWALSFQYPDDLKYKLFERRTDCYQALGKKNEAATSCQEAINYLALAEDPPADKMTLLSLTLENLSVETKKRSKPPKDREGPTEMKFVPTKTYGDHPTIPAASDCLEIVYNEEYGHHAVSTRDIKPGDILVIEEPLVAMPSLPNNYSYCYNCTLRSDAMIPCRSCSLVMFCTEDCRSLAWESYHRIECRILPLINEHDIGLNTPLSLRVLLVALSKYAGNSLEKLWEIVNELEEANKNNEPKSGFGHPGQPYPLLSGYPGIHYLDRQRLFREDIVEQAMDLEFCLQIALLSAILVNCLDSYTDMFEQKSEAGPSSGELKILAGRLMIRYHLISVANARTYGDCDYYPGSICFVEVDVGQSLHHLLSFFNHSCCCNTTLLPYNGSTLYMVANQPIKKGDQLFINYGCQFFGTNRTKRALVLINKHVVCCCQACLEDWPTADGLIDSFTKPTMVCSKCRTPLPQSSQSMVKCPKCRLKKNVAYVTRIHRDLTRRMKALDGHAYRRSCLTKDLTPELSKYLIFMYEHYKMPNMDTLRIQHSLTEGFKRYCNYSGMWAPE